MTTETRAGQQRGRPFAKGRSGNPLGRPKGSRHASTLAMEALLDGEAERLTRKIIEAALAGDSTAMRLCFERILPPRKDRPVWLELPTLKTAADAMKATSTIVAAAAAGELTPSEAGDLSKLVDGFRLALSTADLEERLIKLEATITP